MLAFGTVTGQTTRSKEKKDEVTVKTKKEGSEKMTIVIDGDNITINGKPVTEYKGDNIIIRRDGLNELNYIKGQDMARMHEDLAKMERDLHRSLEPQMRELERMKTKPYRYYGGDNYDFDYHFDAAPEMRAISDGKPRTQLGISMEKAENGIKVTDVVSESAAGKAGLKDGDVITKFDGKAVTDPENMGSLVRAKKPGDEVEIAYLPVGQKKEKKIKLKLGETKSPPRTMRVTAPRVYVTPGKTPEAYGWDREFNDEMFPKGPEGQFFRYDNRGPMFGIRIQDTEDSSGVKVLDVDDNSLADNVGIQENDIITQIDGKPVKDTDDARHALQDAREKNLYSVNLKRNGTPMTMQVKVPVKLKKAEL